MALRVTVGTDFSFTRAVEQEVSISERAVQSAVRERTNRLKQQLRDQVTGAGMGRRLANTWRGDIYPPRGHSINAAGWVYSNAPEIINAHSSGETIRARQGRYLAVPTDNAPKRGPGGKAVSPTNFPAKFGELRFVPRRNGPPLLVVDAVRITKTGRVGKQLKNQGRTKTGRLRKGAATVVMFVLVPQVRLRPVLDPESAFRTETKRMPGTLVRAFRNEDQRPRRIGRR